MNYLIGLDGGTQSTKVTIFDLDGNVICRAQQALQPMSSPEPGVAEHPDDDIWDSTAAACRDAMAQFPHDPQLIVGIGVCTIRCCRALLKEDGSLAAPIINWMDRRLSMPYEGGDENVRYVTTTSGYITHRLCGEFKDTAANYEGAWPINKDNWQWSAGPGVIEAFNVSKQQLFELVMPATVVGRISEQAAQQTSLPKGLPVVATANDKAVEALGAGLRSNPDGKNTALISLGTYIGGMVYGDKNMADAEHYFANMAAIPGQYLYESGGIRNGMANISWLKELFGAGLADEAEQLGLSPENLLNKEAAEVAAGADGLLTVPEWLAPPDKPFKRGAIIGLHNGHSRAHLYRSMLEAIALTMKNHIDAMYQELGQQLDQLIISGGGANSDLFMQIFSDVFGVATLRNVVADAAGLGSAISAAVAVGAHDSFDSAINSMVGFAERFEPDEASSRIYGKINHDVYCDITIHTDRILSKT